MSLLIQFCVVQILSSTDYRPPRIRFITLKSDARRSCFNGDIINDDIALEGVETFSLNIEKPVLGRVVVDQNTTNINIIDDDGKPQ